jgi:hypothetical protein
MSGLVNQNNVAPYAYPVNPLYPVQSPNNSNNNIPTFTIPPQAANPAIPIAYNSKNN